MNKHTLFVVAKPTLPCLRLLDRLPEDTALVVGDQAEMFDERAGECDVLMNLMSPLDLFRQVFSKTVNVRWVHSFSAGVENTLFPELISSPVPMTNGRGVFSRSLAEFVIAGALFFDKKLAYMRKLHQESRWELMDLEELYGKTMGLVSYGSIARECARLAKAFGMRVIATRRRPEMSAGDEYLDQTFPIAGLDQMMAQSDYVVVTSPNTPATQGLVDDRALRAMKPTALLMNIGRGPVVVERALVEALRENRIRGAVLDVFDVEPLPPDHPFYALDNVLLSPHSADHIPGWMDHAIEFFLENFERYRSGRPLENIVDKQAGY